VAVTVGSPSSANKCRRISLVDDAVVVDMSSGSLVVDMSSGSLVVDMSSGSLVVDMSSPTGLLVGSNLEGGGRANSMNDVPFTGLLVCINERP